MRQLVKYASRGVRRRIMACKNECTVEIFQGVRQDELLSVSMNFDLGKEGDHKPDLPEDFPLRKAIFFFSLHIRSHY